MKKFSFTYLTSGAFLLPALAFAQESTKFKLDAVPTNSIFSETDKPTTLMNYVLWTVSGAAGIAAIGCFIIAGNYGTRGDWGKCGAGIVGGIITAIGSYMAATVQ